MENDFAEGIWIKKINTKFGEIIKTEIAVDTFIKYLHLNKNENGRVFLETKTSKKGNLYTVLDTFVPTPKTKNVFDKNFDPKIPDDIHKDFHESQDKFVYKHNQVDNTQRIGMDGEHTLFTPNTEDDLPF